MKTTKRGRGRPPKDPAEVADSMVSVRMTQAERRQVEEKAAPKPISVYMREKALGCDDDKPAPAA